MDQREDPLTSQILYYLHLNHISDLPNSSEKGGNKEGEIRHTDLGPTLGGLEAQQMDRKVTSLGTEETQ